MEPNRRFRIAFSFAREKRAFVAQVAAILAERFGEDAILYDKYHEAEFARHDLGLILPQLYGEQSDLIVPVLTPDYDVKRWTGWEWLHIYGLLTKSGGRRVMPTRFGYAKVGGLSEAAAFIELDDKSPEYLAMRILERLALNEGKPKDFYTKRPSPYWGRGTVEFTVEEGNIVTFDADVVVLKHAQEFYGADATVARILQESGVSVERLSPKIGEYVYLESRGSVRAAHVLFVGTPPLFEFEYDDIRRFSAGALEGLAEVSPETMHVAMTIHGVGYGLDETAAAHAQFDGLWDSLRKGNMPHALKTISIIDVNPERVKRLRELFDSAFERVDYAERAGRERWAYRLDIESGQDKVRLKDSLEALTARAGVLGIGGVAARGKETPHVFVAMPFKEETEDVFYYGIQKSVHSIDYLCERIDQESFTGDILERMKKRIETAALVIADLTGDNPNVFLEVGYAWGQGRPTVLVVKQGKQQLRFDVQGQRCIKYKNIRNLEELLTKLLGDLKSNGSI